MTKRSDRKKEEKKEKDNFLTRILLGIKEITQFKSKNRKRENVKKTNLHIIPAKYYFHIISSNNF